MDVGAVHVVHLEADGGDEVGLGEETLRVGEADEGVAGIVLVEAGVEDTGDRVALVLGDEAERGKLSLRTGDEDGVADFGTDGLGEVLADDDGRDGLRGRWRRWRRAADLAAPRCLAGWICRRSETVRWSAGTMPSMSARRRSWRCARSRTSWSRPGAAAVT